MRLFWRLYRENCCVIYRSILYPFSQLIYFFVFQDAWEEVDPDELSYEVSWPYILVLLLEHIFQFSNQRSYSIISGVASTEWSSWNREQRAFSWYNCLLAYSKIQDREHSEWKQWLVSIHFIVLRLYGCVFFYLRAFVLGVSFAGWTMMMRIPWHYSLAIILTILSV